MLIINFPAGKVEHGHRDGLAATKLAPYYRKRFFCIVVVEIVYAVWTQDERCLFIYDTACSICNIITTWLISQPYVGGPWLQTERIVIAD
jgi:hypothetical protein